jgi:hypothetical protein
MTSGQGVSEPPPPPPPPSQDPPPNTEVWTDPFEYDGVRGSGGKDRYAFEVRTRGGESIVVEGPVAQEGQ